MSDSYVERPPIRQIPVYPDPLPSPAPAPSWPPTDIPRDHRRRLLDAMLAVANRDGFPAATVSAVIAHAGVSRPTFYEHFANRLDCFLALHGEVSAELLERVGCAVGGQSVGPPLARTLGAICAWASERPAAAGLLLNQTVAAGAPALDARDRTLQQLELLVERAHAHALATELSPDLPTRAGLGALFWLLAPRLRRREHDPQLTGALLDWLARYDRPAGEHRWRTLAPGPLPPPSAHVSQLPSTPPPPIPPGRTRLTRDELARNQRERILHAAALLAASFPASPRTPPTSASRPSSDPPQPTRSSTPSCHQVERPQVHRRACHRSSHRSPLGKLTAQVVKLDGFPACKLSEAGLQRVECIGIGEDLGGLLERAPQPSDI